MTRRILIGLLLYGFAVQAVGAQPDSTPAPTSRLCVLPVNVEHGVRYEGGGRVDSLTWGPSALTVAPDGRFVIADAARSRLVEYGSDCAFRRVLDLSGKVAGISDVKVTGEGYFVLDDVAAEPVVLQLDAAARVLRRFPVAEALARELPSLLIEDGNRVLLGLREGRETVSLREAGMPFAAEARVAGVGDRGVRLVTSLEESEDGQRLVLSRGSREIEVDSDMPVASFTVLGVAGDRHVYARATEVTEIAGTLRVRESVYRVTSSGRVDGVARELFADQHVFVQNRLAVDARKDRVLALLTYPDRAEIHQLVFSDPAGLAPRTLPESDEATDELADGSIFEAAEEEARCKVYPGQIRRVANGYINNSTVLSNKNIVQDGTCANRTKPPYLKGPGTYKSVPYDWGGFDSVADFNRFMKEGAKAGDVETSKTAVCSKGVDCSGFVSRTWGLKSKRGSVNIGEISTRLAEKKELRFGDILNKDSHHVALIDSVTETVNIYEAVTEGHNKVVRRATPWSRYSGYRMLRYNNYCEKAASQIGCVGQSPQLFVDVPLNLTGGRFAGQGKGHDYDGEPLYFKVVGDFNRTTRALQVDLEFYTDPGFSHHARTDRCSGLLHENDQFSDARCELIRDTSAQCPIYLLMSLRGEAGGNAAPAPAPSPGQTTIVK